MLLEEVNVETGLTPKEVVWEKDKVKLYRYRSPGPACNGDAGSRHRVPILLVYALVLKPYLLDLAPGNSLVEYLVREGFDVYLLDFGSPEYEDAGLTLEDYVLGYLDGAVGEVLRRSGAEELSLFGQSQGGTFCAMYAALHPSGPVKNLILLSTPTDFAPRNPGPLGMWTLASSNSQMIFEPRLVPQVLGNLPTELASNVIGSASSLQATALRTFATWPALFGGPRLYDSALEQTQEWSDRDLRVRSWLAVCKWVDDAASFPGEAFQRWIKDFYQRNKLVKGKVELGGRRVDLSNIRCPTLNVSGDKDYSVPASQGARTTDIIGSPDKQDILLDAGHVGIVVGPGAKDGLWPEVRDWLAPRSLPVSADSASVPDRIGAS